MKRYLRRKSNADKLEPERNIFQLAYGYEEDKLPCRQLREAAARGDLEGMKYFIRKGSCNIEEALHLFIEQLSQPPPSKQRSRSHGLSFRPKREIARTSSVSSLPTNDRPSYPGLFLLDLTKNKDPGEPRPTLEDFVEFIAAEKPLYLGRCMLVIRAELPFSTGVGWVPPAIKKGVPINKRVRELRLSDDEIFI